MFRGDLERGRVFSIRDRGLSRDPDPLLPLGLGHLVVQEPELAASNQRVRDRPQRLPRTRD